MGRKGWVIYDIVLIFFGVEFVNCSLQDFLCGLLVRVRIRAEMPRRVMGVLILKLRSRLLLEDMVLELS